MKSTETSHCFIVSNSHIELLFGAMILWLLECYFERSYLHKQGM